VTARAARFTFVAGERLAAAAHRASQDGARRHRAMVSRDARVAREFTCHEA
jgi:hypothetical protein